MGVHSNEWALLPTQNAARTAAYMKQLNSDPTSVPSTVAFSSVGGVPLELMAPAHSSAFLCVSGVAA
ncbi:unnamed protein product [Staurois parvus]|uniref:Uncharacterized protein n=1 Tax=Staurois parvus TaxID=386267 RepID=A0ABN9DEC7_9NEOB|nr:unnamed protein product [Staurois parvus]